MQNKLISIIIGAVLVVGTGTLVYTTKKPVVLPLENTGTSATGLTGETPVVPKTGVTGAVQNLINKIDSDDDEDDDDDDYNPGSVTGTTVPTPTTPVPTQPTTQPTAGGITLAQIASHNSNASCWSAVNGSVYDLTSWIPNHPGGSQSILSMCGIDGSASYNNQHGGGSKPARILAGFKLGALAK